MADTDKSRLIDLDEVVATKFKGKKVPRFVVNLLKRYVRQDYLNSVIARSGDGAEFCTDFLKELEVTLEVSGLDDIPNDGSLYTFASNHPLGGIDGLALTSVLGGKFGDVKLQVNDFLMFVKPIAEMSIPVNKMGAQSRNLPAQIDALYKSDKQVMVFPAGLCSRKIDGRIQDLPWTKTFIKKSIANGRKIVPVHFEGQNSNLFYFVARLCKVLKLKTNFAMYLLPREMFKARGAHFKITFGKPIPVETFDSSKSALGWAGEVRKMVYEL